MINENYLMVAEIAKKKRITAKTVRNKILKLIGVVADNMILKDKNNQYRVHNSLLPKFEPEKRHSIKYIAINVDPVTYFSKEDIHKTMIWLLDYVKLDKIEINFSIEAKKKNGRNHLHIYIKKNIAIKFLKALKFAYPEMSYYIVKVYDIEGWKSYISKESQIITLKKSIENEK